MAGRHTPLPPLLNSISGHHFGETGKWIIGFIAVTVNVAVKLLRQFKGEMDILDTHITSPFVMRDTANEVTAQFHSLAHQFAPIGEGQNAILWESHQLQIADITHLFTHLDQGFQRDQRGITDIDVATYVKRSLSYFPPNFFQGTPFHILVGQRRFALAPNLDALQQCACRIVTWLSHRQHSVQVHMRIDKRRRDKVASRIDLTCRALSDITGDTSKMSILDGDIYGDFTTV